MSYEEYKISSDAQTIEYGRFTDLVSYKHETSYGKDSALAIKRNVTDIFKKLLKQLNDEKLNNNSLIVGKIQSGKTSNLELLTALAFDNGFQLLVIYGGYDNFLLSQSTKRFETTFTSFDEENDPLIVTSSSDFDYFTIDYVEELINEGRPIIIETMKRPSQLEKVNEAIDKIKELKLKAFIIDDEGDQASLNTNIDDPEDKASATYKCIRQMKELLNDPLYLSVTATPQANIYQPRLSALNPDSIHLLYPGNGYDGVDVFHLKSDKIIIVKDTEKQEILDAPNLPSDVKNAINHFLIGSAILKKRGKRKTEMIIHTYRKISNHLILADKVNNYLQTIRDCIHNSPELVDIFLEEIKKTYIDKFFDIKTINDNPWNDELINNLISVIKCVYVEQKNSQEGHTPEELKKINNIIYIGGDLLQRGITFKNLITTYFTRWSVNGNMDTSLQRARWFGYREDCLDIFRIFMTREIKDEFAHLASIENDLWDQFSMVVNGNLSMNDIFIDATDTNLNPTRANVANIRKVSFRTKWINQRYIAFDDNDIEINNGLLENLLKNKPFKVSTIGRTDCNTSTYYTTIHGNELCEFIRKTKTIFDILPFEKNSLISQLYGQNVIVQVMFDGDLNKCRKRSCIDNKISALQQGADSTDLSKRKYKGDSFVLVDSDSITIQVFRVVPYDDDKRTVQNEKMQYMYSIHFPAKSARFVRG